MLAYRSLNEIKSAPTRAGANVGLTEFLGLMLHGICVCFVRSSEFPLLFFLLFNFVRSEWLIDKTQPSFHINDLKIYVSFLRILITFQFSKKSFLSKELQRIFRKWYFFIDFDTYIYLYIWFIPYIRKGRCYSYFYQGINLRVIFAPP